MRNLTFDEIEIGRPRTISRLLSRPDIEALAFAAGTFDTFELNGNGDRSAESVQAVSAATLIVHLVNRQFPGAGSVIVEESFAFDGELKTGDTVVATLTPVAKDAARRAVTLECAVSDGAGHKLLTGRIVVLAPSVGVEQPESAPTEVIFRRTDALGRLIQRAAQGAPVPTAIVHPCDRDSLLGAIEAARRGLIEPVLVGPEARIRATAHAAEVDLAPYRIEGVEHSHAAAARAVALAHAGEVAALMKGSLHTDELMGAVVARDGGLRTSRRISHVFLLDVPAYPRLLLVTDAAVNVAPDVATKADILQNAFDLAHAIGIDEPKAAVLAAVETVNPAMAATVDAAMLCKMVDRGQISGGLVDGPLAFDNAISEEAARIKGITSSVAGRADILLAPDLEAGNMVAKQLQYLAGADSAGIVLGARVPIVLTSRADSVRNRLASAAVMKLLAQAQRAAAAAKATGG
ncbi:MAG TPA: bifunctional enoyl-CoA hydratase/phosphate acetyltransferase [Burkholderiaceae bacterium]|nr:bifunctional enoyl-CoA hydratase/phosphate acetyltransferase [Burkholderiaceae bacterium]